MIVKRGEVYFADLDPAVGSEQGGFRPVVIIQNDIGNTFSTTTIAALTTNTRHSRMPTHVVSVAITSRYATLWRCWSSSGRSTNPG